MPSIATKYRSLEKLRNSYLDFLQDAPSESTEFETVLPIESVLNVVNEIHRIYLQMKAIEGLNMIQLQEQSGDYIVKTKSILSYN